MKYFIIITNTQFIYGRIIGGNYSKFKGENDLSTIIELPLHKKIYNKIKKEYGIH